MSDITERAIIDATLALAEKKPFNRITIKDITSGLGISRNTFYYHFRDIYDVLARFLSYEVFSKLDKAASIDEYFSTVNTIFKKLNREKGVFVKIYRAIGFEPFKNLAAQRLSSSIYRLIRNLDTQSCLSENDLRLLASFYQHALVGILIDWLNNDDIYTDSELDIIIGRLTVLFSGQLELLISNAELLS